MLIMLIRKIKVQTTQANIMPLTRFCFTSIYFTWWRWYTCLL